MALAVAAPLAGLHSRTRIIRLLDAEPDFAAGVDARHVAEARRRALAPVVTLSPGEWHPAELQADPALAGPFAGLVLSGLLAQECRLAGRTTSQLVGPGDVIPIHPHDESTLNARLAWRVVSDVRLVVLDDRFLGAAQRWPWLTARMMERASRWAGRALVLQAIGQVRGIDARIVALLWHLADRWGRVTPGGVVLPLRLTHAELGTLVGAQRPTVTLALKALRDRGSVRPHEGGWLLDPAGRDA